MQFRRHIVVTVVLLAVATASALVAAAQQREQVPVFRARTDLVQLYATVRDANGNPVKGLRAEDFTVFDNDLRVNLEVVAEFEGRTFEGPDWAREHSVNVSTNQPIENKRLVIIVLDDARMPFRGSSRQRMLDLGRQLVKNLAPDDLACVVFTATNQGAQEFTSDRALLLKSVDSLGGGFEGVPIMPAYSVDVVRRAAATLADTPARRKMLIFVGHGQAISVLPPSGSKPVSSAPPGSRYSLDALGVAGRVDALLKAAQKAGIAVYMLHPSTSMPRLPDWNPGILFVKDVAKHTGAIAIIGEPDPSKAANRIYADAGHYYVLGFRPDDSVRPGMYRKIRVSVSQPTIEVRSQTGYYPPKTIVGDEPLPELKGAPTTVALAGALPTGELRLQMGLTSFARRSSTGSPLGQIAVALETAPVASGITPPAGAVQTEVRVFDGEGRREIFANTERRQILAAGQISPQPLIEVPPGRYNVRVGLQHEASKLISSVYGTITVPNFAKDALSASDVFVQLPGIAPDAWRTGISSVRRTFSQTEAVSLVVGLYVSQKPLTTSVQTELFNAANAVVHRESRTVLVGGDPGQTGTEVRVDLPLTKLTPGPYLAKITMTSGKTTLMKTLVFEVR